jgi:photosynthetic reaction center cytochrome c subunit
MIRRNRRISSKWRISTACGTIVVFFLGVVLAGGQTRTEQKPLMAEDSFKNVQVLKGIPVNQFMATMGFFSASLGENCTYCHVAESGGSWEKYADDNAHKRTARRMIAMVNAINKQYFGGQRELTCYSCHRGGDRPRVTPSLEELYGPPHLEEPDQFVEQRPNGPSAAQVLDKYIQAAGGTQRLATLTSFYAKGTYKGFSDVDARPVEIFSKAPNQRTTIVHTLAGNSVTTFDGRTGWTAAPATESPLPVSMLTGGDADGARLDAELAFPARINQSLRQWRIGFPTLIDNREVQVVQGTSDGRYPVNLYFDSKSGLLVRQVRYTDSPVGLSPTQIDYADYRDVSGILMPFRWTMSWLDGRSTTELTDVQTNLPIDAEKFSRPAPTAK